MTYRERSATAKIWRRPKQVVVTQDGPSRVTVSVIEEDVIEVDGIEMVTDTIGGLRTALDLADGEIPLRNLTTGALTGAKVTHAQLRVILLSLYLQLAEARDASQPPAP